MFGCADGDNSVIVRVAICGMKMGPFFPMVVFLKDRKLWFGNNIGYSERLRYMTVWDVTSRFCLWTANWYITTVVLPNQIRSCTGQKY